MKVMVCREFYFDAAHQVPKHPGKCSNIHGHTYKLEVCVKGELNEMGMVIDFGDMKKIVKSEIIDVLDHKLINSILPNPTAENIAIWVFNKLKPKFEELGVELVSVKIWEGVGKWAEVTK
jgi:6-pyruvoyltetrahydropterin/6-carboxytetrahydropterin synthase